MSKTVAERVAWILRTLHDPRPARQIPPDDYHHDNELAHADADYYADRAEDQETRWRTGT